MAVNTAMFEKSGNCGYTLKVKNSKFFLFCLNFKLKLKKILAQSFVGSNAPIFWTFSSEQKGLSLISCTYFSNNRNFGTICISKWRF